MTRSILNIRKNDYEYIIDTMYKYFQTVSISHILMLLTRLPVLYLTLHEVWYLEFLLLNLGRILSQIVTAVLRMSLHEIEHSRNENLFEVQCFNHKIYGTSNCTTFYTHHTKTITLNSFIFPWGNLCKGNNDEDFFLLSRKLETERTYEIYHKRMSRGMW